MEVNSIACILCIVRGIVLREILYVFSFWNGIICQISFREKTIFRQNRARQLHVSSPTISQILKWFHYHPPRVHNLMFTFLKVLSSTQLFRDFKNHDKFIACGLEPLKKTTSFSDSSTEADSADGRGRFELGVGDEGDRKKGGKYTVWHRRKMNRRLKGKGGTANVSQDGEFQSLVW